MLLLLHQLSTAHVLVACVTLSIFTEEFRVINLPDLARLFHDISVIAAPVTNLRSIFCTVIVTLDDWTMLSLLSRITFVVWVRGGTFQHGSFVDLFDSVDFHTFWNDLVLINRLLLDSDFKPFRWKRNYKLVATSNLQSSETTGLNRESSTVAANE